MRADHVFAIGTGPARPKNASERGTIFAVLISDTSPDAQAIQLEIQKVMTGEQRLLLALEMSLFAREMSKTRIRTEHPEWSEAQVARESLRLAFLPEPLPAGFHLVTLVV